MTTAASKPRVKTAAELRRLTPIDPPAQEVVPVKAALPAAPGDSVTAYLDEIAPVGAIVGRLLKFSKGRFFTSDDDKDVPENARFTVLAEETLVGWVRFRPDSAPDRVQGLLYGGFQMPPRGVLGDTDQNTWEVGLDNKPSDPWQHHLQLVLQEAGSGELYTFVTSTPTGRSAVGKLLRHYERTKKKQPDELPVVQLRVGGFPHKDPRVGWVATPTFVVCGSTNANGVPKSAAEELNDKIPL
jgi:hypothetical protein